MVNNSELAFRRLVRRHGCQLTYSPMIVARKFVALSDAARCALVEPDPADRPFIVQFAGDNPEVSLSLSLSLQVAFARRMERTLSLSLSHTHFLSHTHTHHLSHANTHSLSQDILEAGRIIQRLGLADAIDLNLGCPQGPAVRDHYGSPSHPHTRTPSHPHRLGHPRGSTLTPYTLHPSPYTLHPTLYTLHPGSILMEEPELVERIVAAAAHGLAIPVTVKIRVFKDVDRTVPSLHPTPYTLKPTPRLVGIS